MALLPLGIGAVGLMGGAIGGGLGGGFTGLLITLNLAVARRERWSHAARFATCLGISLAGYVVLAAVLIALVKSSMTAPAAAPPPVASVPPPSSPPGPSVPTATETGSGTAVDPDGDCRIAVQGDATTIEVPGTIHELWAGTVDQFASADETRRGRFRGGRPSRRGARLPSTPRPAHLSFQGAGLLLWQGSTNFVRLERAAFRRAGALHAYVFSGHLDLGLPPREQGRRHAARPPVPAARASAGFIHAAYGTDGVQWTTFAPLPGGQGGGSVGVHVVNTGAARFQTRFEGFRLETGPSP